MRITMIAFVGAVTSLFLMFATARAPAPANVITSSNERGWYRLELTGGEAASRSTNMLPLASCRFGEKVYLCSIIASNLVRGPRWDTDTSEPPLSPKFAVAIAQRHAWRLFPDTRILEI